MTNITTSCNRNCWCLNTVLVGIISYYSLISKSICNNWIFAILQKLCFINVTTCNNFKAFIP